jgi:TonB-linked SusC/RagA family outer membrane protein
MFGKLKVKPFHNILITMKTMYKCFLLLILFCFVGGNTIYAYSKNKIEYVADLQVTGKVVSAQSKLPLMGVSITEKGTSRGTATNANGEFSINVANAKSILVFSFVGYSTQEVIVGNRSQLNISLTEDDKALDEVVVIGYGSQKKSDLTGSVASIKSRDLVTQVAINPVQSLSGRAAGVQVVQNSGEPGSNISVRIRGGNSILGNNEPLYVLDGFPLAGSPSSLSPNDVESIEVLKDASATAIYGSRGANGVVLITTKKGKNGQSKVEFDSYYGVQEAAKTIDMLNAKEFAQLANLRAANDGDKAFFTTEQINSFGEGTNWQNEVLRKAIVQNHVITISGGNEKTQYSLSGNYFNQEGILVGSNFWRGQVRTNLQHRINNIFSVSFSSVLNRTQRNSLNSDNTVRGQGVLSGALIAPPTLSPLNANGEYNSISSYAFSPDVAENPLAMGLERKQLGTNNGVLANLGLTAKILPDLVITSTAGIENITNRSDFYSPTILKLSATGVASTSNSELTSVVNENFLTYNKIFGESHKLTALTGLTYQNTMNSGVTASSTGFLNNVLSNYNLQSGSGPGIPTSFLTEFSILSYLGRLNYSYNDKYLVTFSARTDGSSRFGRENRWGYFPSGAIAWRVSEEDFLKNSKVISDLKFRAGWGITGSTAVNPYQSLQTLNSTQTVFDRKLFIGFAPSPIQPNSALKWETTTQYNVGVDASFLNNRFQFSIDLYDKITSDLLANVNLPTSTGYTTVTLNAGKIQNKGIELAAGAKILDGNFKWDVDGNISFNRSEVLELNKGTDILSAPSTNPFLVSASLNRVGQPMNAFFGFVENGLDANGNIKYVDQDGNNTINDRDRVIIGDPNPDYIFGFNSRMSYKNFELTAFISGVQGNQILNFNKKDVADGFAFGINQIRDVLGNYWTKENPNPNARYPRISKTTTYRLSDRYVEDGSFIRLRNVQLAYNLPTSKIGIKSLGSAQIYLAGQNLFTITNYSWYDPEVNTQGGGNSTSQGFDTFGFPVSRMFTAGVRLGF